ncbi:TonB-dependent receptor plug domain-containing protein [Pelagerythrobacter marinus]|uniref:TonB-dependent receptor plug domain-containing protein n=1 Tax=Pelagerythrobacter marinus TaxID=538382 RepID=UPI002036CE24|nr:TonB-dependent receptor [Pelagerythrobacter marinus]USA39945.1 TonB-dependent receptor [Pelagerythrobacter marinus]WPZ05936.1 TonB-dependent receptor [Pelagerythrobacter marinus]
MKNSTILKASAAPVALGLALASAPAFAQDAEGEGTASAAVTGPTIVVTGSRIANPNLEQSSPVQVVSADDIAIDQATNAEELLVDLPGVVPGFGNNVNNGSGGFAALNLRGLGTNRNLVLLDGTRVVPSTLTSTTDLNIIPVALVERVEVVTGGASSVYGADAIAGVANFVLKNDFQGAEVSSTMGITERGDGRRFRTDVTLGAGFDDGRGNVALSLGYQNVNPVLQGDREISRKTLFVGGQEIGSGTSVPTRINGDQYDPDTGDLVPTYNTFNFAPFNYFQTPLERFNVFATANYEVTDGVELYTKGMFTKATVQLQLAPSGLFGDAYQFPLNNPFLTDSIRNSICAENDIDAATCAAAGAAADPNDPDYMEVPTTINRRLVEMGPRQTDYTTNQFQVWAGVRGNLTSLLEYDVYGTYGESDRNQRNMNWGLKSRVQQALRATDANTCADPSNGCVPINLFGDGQSISPETVAFINQPAGNTVSTSLAVVSGSISGDLTEEGFLGAQTPIGIAIGAEYRDYSASQISDVSFGTQDEVLGTGAPSPSYSGGYDVKEVFGEIIIPLIEDSFIRNATIEAGLRYSDYSNTGTSLTWKAGGSIEPVDGFKFRGIYQKAVRSPNIAELFLPVTTGLATLATDPCQGAAPANDATLRSICLAQGAPAGSIGSIPAPSAGQVNATSGGNPDLDVETAKSYTLGVVLTPSFVPRLVITADYYNIKITDAITTPTTNDILDPCFGPDGNSPNPSAPECALVGRNPLNGSLNGGGETTGLFLGLTNQGTIETSGVDARITYGMPTGFGGLDFDLGLNWVDEIKFKASPASINRECVGQYSSNCSFFNGEIVPEWAANARVTANLDDFGAISLRWRWIDKVVYEEILSTDGILEDYLEIPSAHYFDLNVRADVNDNMDVTFGVFNLFDKSPPNVSSYIGTTAQNSGNTYPSTYDVLGRRYSVTARLRF